ncbi:AbrB/MazE/SpoVT family DNA-binding domain-containing protein [Desulfovirgula thermocuniculi]|uniref:AbrB/MazE/SpoVT family DNA-binding domain-containing protein n=1 Tax=Desulfovirgula thermocuniculi TaxID=348842 RepID=UPI0004857DD1|nr:AbrB/MazE/SpoVT family DNA-binding domain-containing protein [Desulfovirgula thermocuniculi]
MQLRVARWGNSLGIRIPKPVAEKLGLAAGVPVTLEVEKDALIIRRKRYKLEALLAGVNPKNIHGEVETGKPVGREIW